MEKRIRAKLAELTQQKEQALAQIHAIAGAEQVLLQLLEPESKKEDSPQ